MYGVSVSKRRKSFSQNVMYCVSGEVTAALSQMCLCFKGKKGWIYRKVIQRSSLHNSWFIA